MPSPDQRSLDEAALWDAIHQLALAVLAKWSEEERRYRKLHEESVRTQNALIRRCWTLGISPSVIAKIAEIPESSLFTKLNLRADPDLRRQRDSIAKGNEWSLRRWTGELEKLTQGAEEGAGVEPR